MELTKILLKAQRRALDDLLDTSIYDFFMDNGIELGQSLLPMNLRIQVAIRKGLPVNAYNKLSYHAQQAQKSWHLEVDSKYAAKMKSLVQCTKEYGFVEEVWGCHPYLSKVIDAKSTASEAKQQVDVAQAHTNYQLSMVAEELVGVTKLDKQVDIFNLTTHESVGRLSLCMVLLNYLKMQDDYPMIAEVHQEDLCKPTHIIIPQAKDAERMIGIMNMNLPAFLYHMLLKADFH